MAIAFTPITVLFVFSSHWEYSPQATNCECLVPWADTDTPCSGRVSMQRSAGATTVLNWAFQKARLISSLLLFVVRKVKFLSWTPWVCLHLSGKMTTRSLWLSWQPTHEFFFKFIHSITIFGENIFFIKTWNASCLLSLWSIWEQCEPSYWGIMLNTPLSFPKSYADFQLDLRFWEDSASFSSVSGFPFTLTYMSTLKTKGIHSTNVWQAPTMYQRLCKDTSVDKTENKPCHLGLPLCESQGTHSGIWTEDALAGHEWAWAAPSTLQPSVSSSRRYRIWTRPQTTWMSPRDPKLLILSADEPPALIELFCSMSFT